MVSIRRTEDVAHCSTPCLVAPQEKRCSALSIEYSFSFPENYFISLGIVNLLSDQFPHVHTKAESFHEKLRGVFKLIKIFVYVLIHVRSLSYLLGCVIALYFPECCIKSFLIRGGM